MSDDTPAGEAAPAPAPPAAPAPAPVANPFVPRYREPWINPAKRTAVTVIGAAAVVVLLALGFLLGVGLGSGGRHHGMHPGRPADRYGRGYYGGPAPRGPAVGPGSGRYPHGPGTHYYGSYVPAQSPSSASASPVPSHS